MIHGREDSIIRSVVLSIKSLVPFRPPASVDSGRYRPCGSHTATACMIVIRRNNGVEWSSCEQYDSAFLATSLILDVLLKHVKAPHISPAGAFVVYQTVDFKPDAQELRAHIAPSITCRIP